MTVGEQHALDSLDDIYIIVYSQLSMDEVI